MVLDTNPVDTSSLIWATPQAKLCDSGREMKIKFAFFMMTYQYNKRR